ncbi:hypothetical protein V5799_014260 [Amblyomma americanum]|uniref:Uncharacterized protein n=1 Tax=Amblyomma americanum TaxID=6943 RepID=A0AAQ4E3J6_AMBAM
MDAGAVGYFLALFVLCERSRNSSPTRDNVILERASGDKLTIAKTNALSFLNTMCWPLTTYTTRKAHENTLF